MCPYWGGQGGLSVSWGGRARGKRFGGGGTEGKGKGGGGSRNGGGDEDGRERTYQVIMKEAKYATCRSSCTSMAAYMIKPRKVKRKPSAIKGKRRRV